MFDTCDLSLCSVADDMYVLLKQICSVVRYHIMQMEANLKSQLENTNTVDKYTCPNCGKRYEVYSCSRKIKGNIELYLY